VRTSSSGRGVRESGAAVAGPGLRRPPDPTKGPCRGKAPLAHLKASPFTRRRSGEPGVSFTLTTVRATNEARTAARAKARARVRERRRGDRGVRGTIAPGTVGTKRPRSWIRDREVAPSRKCVRCRSAEAVSSVVKTLGPPVMSRGASDSAGRPRGASRGSEPGTHEVRVHAVRLGGRRRLDASRVFGTGRSQGLVEQEGASQEEAHSPA